MQVSVYFGSYRHKDPDKFLKLLKDAGLNAIDFSLENAWERPKFWQAILPEDNFFMHSDEEVLGYYKPLVEKIKSYGIDLFQGHAPFPSGVPDRPHTIKYANEVIKRSVDIAAKIGIKNFVIHGSSLFGWDKVNSLEDIDNMNWELYSQLASTLKGTNTVVCLEDMFADIEGIPIKGHGTNAKDTADLIDKLNALCDGETHFGYCLDIGHMTLAGVDVYPFIKTLGKRITCLHIHDNFGGYKDSHALPYFASMDYKDFLQGLKDVGYDGAINFEVDPLAKVPEELYPAILKLVYKTGEYFYRAIKGLEPIK